MKKSFNQKHGIVLMFLMLNIITSQAQAPYMFGNWQMAKKVFANEFTHYKYTSYIDFTSNHTSNYAVQKSTDCGQNYALVRDRHGFGSCYVVVGAEFMNQDIGFVGEICATELHIYKTINGGNTWAKIGSKASGYGATFAMIDLFDAVYTDASTIRTLNSSSAYSNSLYNFPDSVTNIHCIDTTHFFISCIDTTNNAILLESLDRGVTWTEVLNIAGIQFTDIEFSSDSVGLVISNSGTIYRTVDGGQNWTLGNTPIINQKSLSFANDSVVYIGGLGGSVVSRDRGLTWGTDSTTILSDIRNMKAFDSGVVYYDLTNGNVVRTGTTVAACVSTKTTQLDDLGQDISVYPNPTSNDLNLEMPSSLDLLNIAIYNLNGQVAKQCSIASTTINIGDLPKGIYLLKVITNEGSFSKLITKM